MSSSGFMNGGMLSVATTIAVSVAITLASSARVVNANGDSILLQSTTSTRNSGLYDYLLPKLKRATGLSAHVVAVGTGQAIRNARNCDADLLLVHARTAEEKFVADGYGVERLDLMYNDFVIVGPEQDPAKVREAEGLNAALAAIYESKSLFASRGDDSGTHRKELSLWKAAALDPRPASGRWYLETGSGMGATLNIGTGKRAYVLTDRATWIAFQNKGSSKILLEGSDDLLNQYGVILVSKTKCPNVNAESGQRAIDWLTSLPGQQAIASFKRQGKQLFFPNAQR